MSRSPPRHHADPTKRSVIRSRMRRHATRAAPRPSLGSGPGAGPASEVGEGSAKLPVLPGHGAALIVLRPAAQATIPDVLPDEGDKSRALALSRLADDLESLLSPMLAAALLTVVSFPALIGGTVIGFLASAALVLTVTLPSPRPSAPRGIWDRTTRGIRIYLATPRLRGLLALNLAVAAAGAMVIVNTVALVKARLGLGETEVALALAAFGGGSMVAAFILPRLLDRVSDRPAIMTGINSAAENSTNAMRCRSHVTRQDRRHSLRK